MSKFWMKIFPLQNISHLFLKENKLSKNLRHETFSVLATAITWRARAIRKSHVTPRSKFPVNAAYCDLFWTSKKLHLLVQQ